MRRLAYVEIPNASTAFGENLPEGTLVLDGSTGLLHRLSASQVATDTLQSSTTLSIGGDPNSGTDLGEVLTYLNTIGTDSDSDITFQTIIDESELVTPDTNFFTTALNAGWGLQTNNWNGDNPTGTIVGAEYLTSSGQYSGITTSANGSFAIETTLSIATNQDLTFGYLMPTSGNPKHYFVLQAQVGVWRVYSVTIPAGVSIRWLDLKGPSGFQFKLFNANSVPLKEVSQIKDSTVSFGKLDPAMLGTANGLATLGADGKMAPSQVDSLTPNQVGLNWVFVADGSANPSTTDYYDRLEAGNLVEGNTYFGAGPQHAVGLGGGFFNGYWVPGNITPGSYTPFTYTLARPTAINKYRWIGNGNNGMGVGGWYFEGSHDKVNWVVFDSDTTTYTSTGLSSSGWRTFSNDVPYKYYRLRITSSSTFTYEIYINEIEIVEAQRTSTLQLNPKGSLTAEDASTVDGTYGTEEASVINNLRTRLGELESKLTDLGVLS